ncbi:hypothetical protein [Bradyrhizobium sp. ARR65]|uniref:hypothetical protein n=1 Tax=Bradyrhizobium sp. ARR65 TaxID=1040989 RepID=UPI000A49F4F1|nr:hypothetical protein [Bradyrhizobium sp. ARR65]
MIQGSIIPAVCAIFLATTITAKAQPVGPNIQLGPAVPLGQMAEGTGKVSIPPNAILSHLQLGKVDRPGPRWLQIQYRTIQGEKEWQLGEENSLPATTPPSTHGGSAPIHVPEGSIVSALQLVGGSLYVWYRRVEAPAKFKLGNEEYGVGTKEPPDNGGGNIASKDGYTMTGFQWLKDPDGQLALNIWYRPVL